MPKDKQPIGENGMEAMSAAPRDAEDEATASSSTGVESGSGTNQSGVADEDPLSAHPT